VPSAGILSYNTSKFAMKLLIGLGNPGTKYLRNRHNAGHLLVEFLISKGKLLKNFQVQKTNSFMNDSGIFIKKVINSCGLRPRDLYVAHDDLDLRLGTYKIQFGVGPKVHYGVRSVENELGTKDFWRIRIGVESRILNRGSRIPGEKFVLEDFTSDELKILGQVYAKIGEDLGKS
jgi:PTH1 family peptidyl-tRNA hydrolase